MYLYVKGVGDFAGKYVGKYFNFGQELQSAVDGQVGGSISSCAHHRHQENVSFFSWKKRVGGQRC